MLLLFNEMINDKLLSYLFLAQLINFVKKLKMINLEVIYKFSQTIIYR